MRLLRKEITEHMNRYYSYPEIAMWDDETWKDRQGAVGGLSTWITEHEKAYQTKHPVRIDNSRYAAYTDPDAMDTKTSSINAPEELEYWKSLGLQMECRSLGGTRWISMVPLKAYENRQQKLPTLFVVHNGNYMDPHWAMDTVE